MDNSMILSRCYDKSSGIFIILLKMIGSLAFALIKIGLTTADKHKLKNRVKY